LLIVVPFVIGLVATPVAAGALLDQYRAEVQITVALVRTGESTGGPKPPSNAARLASVRSRILSESQLEPIIREFGLYSVDRQSGPLTEPVQRMRNDIDVQSGEGDVVRVGYRNHDPKIALSVTTRLASVLVGASSVTASQGDTADRFGIQVGPTVAGAPVNQVRPKASFYGGFIGLIVGFALAVFQESRDLTLASEDDVRRMLDVPVLGAISLMTVEHERNTRRRMQATRELIS
jgi:capsular polysaccharide biosynthesis protein